MSDRPHLHNWFLGEYVPSEFKTQTINGGAFFGSVKIPTGEMTTAYSVFVCLCGATKEVIHEEE